MAKKTIAKYFSDLSGIEIESNSPTVYFAIDGTSYEVDLTEEEQTRLREAVAPYAAVGRRAAGGRRASAGGASSTADGPSAKEVRAWAVQQGLDVPARGRVPAEITDAYRAAHQS